MGSEEESEESPSRTRRISWCAKIFEYVRNRNRISPGKIELEDCEFFIVGPRRTLRVLIPEPRGDVYYESRNNERPETIDENFVSRWASRPHPSGNCRCSFRRSSDRPSSREDRIISREIERIRTSLSEAEKAGEDIELVEKRISVNLDALEVENGIEDSKKDRALDLKVKETDEDVEIVENRISIDCDALEDRIEPETTENKIVTDLETKKFSADVENNENEVPSNLKSLEDRNELGTTKKRIVRDLEAYIEKLLQELLTDSVKFFNEADNCLGRSRELLEGNVTPEEDVPAEYPGAYSNPAFIGSENDPDSLDCGRITEYVSVPPEKLDSTDSGINSVETIESHFNSQETSLEKSLIEIMDAKLGRSPSILEERDKTETSEKIEKNNKDCETKREPVISNEPSTAQEVKNDASDLVKLRKHRKPTLVFLHGFGSSAEIFNHQLEYFSSLGYPCVAPELLGHGMSSAPDRSSDYRFDKLLRDLETVLCHYAFLPGKKCVLVAHNYGCSFATALATKYESNVHQLVLISGGGPTPLAPPSDEGPARCFLRALLTPLLVCGLRRDVLYTARGRQHPYCGSEPAEERPSHMRHVLNGMIWPDGDYVFHRRISTPTLLVHGLRDDRVSLVQECQMERTIIKAFLDAIPTAGHTPMIDSPEQVNHTIHCFIDLWRRKRR